MCFLLKIFITEQLKGNSQQMSEATQVVHVYKEIKTKEAKKLVIC